MRLHRRKIDAGYQVAAGKKSSYTRKKYAEFTSAKSSMNGLLPRKDACTQIDAARADLNERKRSFTAGFAALEEAQAQLS